MGEAGRCRATNPFDDSRPYSGDVALDYLIPGRAEHQRAPRLYRRQQRIAVFEAMLDVGEGLAELVDEPVEFAFLSS